MYNINYKKIIKHSINIIRITKALFLHFIILFFIWLAFISVDNDINKLEQYLMFFWILLLPLFIIVILISEIFKISNKIRKIKYLTQYGILMEDIPYVMKKIKRNAYAISAYYIDNNGELVTFVGKEYYSKKYALRFGHADILLDPNDFNNYYVDFSIELKNNDSI